MNQDYILGYLDAIHKVEQAFSRAIKRNGEPNVLQALAIYNEVVASLYHIKQQAEEQAELIEEEIEEKVSRVVMLPISSITHIAIKEGDI